MSSHKHALSDDSELEPLKVAKTASDQREGLPSQIASPSFHLPPISSLVGMPPAGLSAQKEESPATTGMNAAIDKLTIGRQLPPLEVESPLQRESHTMQNALDGAIQSRQLPPLDLPSRHQSISLAAGNGRLTASGTSAEVDYYRSRVTELEKQLGEVYEYIDSCGQSLVAGNVPSSIMRNVRAWKHRSLDGFSLTRSTLAPLEPTNVTSLQSISTLMPETQDAATRSP